MVFRSFDVAKANAIVNHSAVLPFVAGPDHGALDLSPIIADHRNVLLEAEGGFILCCAAEPNTYQVHTAFLPDHRGLHAVDASLAAYRFMFTATDCLTLLTMVPEIDRKTSLATRISTRLVGFELDFAMDAAVWGEAEAVPTRFYSLHYHRWLKRNADALIKAGHAFHDRFEAERLRLGPPSAPRNHPDCMAHDLYAGACAEMIYGGQPEKGVCLYNQWARRAGYLQIQLLSRSPLVIDIGDAVLMMGDQTFKVIKLR
jgi:hypothetical protein